MRNCTVVFDSDGCVFDAMEPKHKKCFGPCAVSIFGLEEIKEAFLEKWNYVNLYSETRGLNRYKALVKVFEEMQRDGYELPDISALKKWCASTKSLSQSELEKVREEDKILELAFQWSEAVNQSIKTIQQDIVPFRYSAETIERISHDAEIFVVSSANHGQIMHVWEKYDLLKYVTEVYGQESGSKTECLKNVKAKGYQRILMVGDAPGDYLAAEAAGTLFYPILPQAEELSWHLLLEKYFDEFLHAAYTMENERVVVFKMSNRLTGAEAPARGQ